MATHCKIINPITYPQWDDLILSHEAYSFFHSSHWARVICETYGYTPLYFTALTDQKIDFLIPVMEVRSVLTGKRGISLPFTDYCIPLISDGSNARDGLDRIFEHGACAGWKFVEIRGGDEYFQVKPSSSYFGHILELSKNEAHQYSRLNGSTRRNIKKAVAEGVEVKFCTDLQSVREFYRLLCMTRQRHGLPPQPFHFFENLHRHIIAENHGVIMLATYCNVIVAGALYLHMGNKAIYKYGASDTKYKKVRANNLIMWEAIKWYSQNGFTSMCFGRTDVDNNGLRSYKAGWGTTETTLNYYKFDIVKKIYVTDSVNKVHPVKKILQYMPITLLKIAGEVLYKHIA